MPTQDVTVPRGPLRLAGQLHTPDELPEGEPRPAIVLSTPGSSVKEQIGANYASRLAERGFIAIAVDPANQGQSEGDPRDLEDPYARGEDLRSTIDFLTTLDAVDADRIGLLGICAGGGYAVHTAMTEPRIKPSAPSCRSTSVGPSAKLTPPPAQSARGWSPSPLSEPSRPAVANPPETRGSPTPSSRPSSGASPTSTSCKPSPTTGRLEPPRPLHEPSACPQRRPAPGLRRLPPRQRAADPAAPGHPRRSPGQHRLL